MEPTDGGTRAASPEPSDEALMHSLATGSGEALQPLYARHAPLVFAIATHSLDRAAAEEVVQDVFLALWRGAERFDPTRGPLRPWLLQIAHNRILNELRARSRRPPLGGDPDGERAAALPDPEAGPATLAWRAFRQDAVRAALARLPPAQRQALGLAFFDELTHEQVAELLQLRLGTAKSRIRAGLLKLREQLVPLLTSLALALLGATLLLAHRHDIATVTLARDERALDLVTSSDVVPLRLEAAPGFPPETHASYRARPGTPLAVLSVSHLVPAPADESYRAWARIADAWIALGDVRPDADGKARLVAQGANLAAPPTSVRITRERTPIGATPEGPLVVAWPKP